jgi:hypothetical protein
VFSELARAAMKSPPDKIVAEMHRVKDTTRFVGDSWIVAPPRPRRAMAGGEGRQHHRERQLLPPAGRGA